MSAAPSPAHFALAIARSRFIDAHAQVEAALIARLRALKLTVHPLGGQNMDELAKAKPAPQYSKKSKASVDKAIGQLRTLQECRNDIVHAQMKIAVLDGAQFACFINPQRTANDHARPLFVDETGLNAMASELARIADDIASA